MSEYEETPEEYVSLVEREQQRERALANPHRGFKTLAECEAHALAVGNVHYFGMGRPCPYCHKFFGCSSDFKRHMEVCDRGWKKSQFGGEYRPSEDDPKLVSLCKKSKIVHLGNYAYSLSLDGRYLKRKLAPK